MKKVPAINYIFLSFCLKIKTNLVLGDILLKLVVFTSYTIYNYRFDCLQFKRYKYSSTIPKKKKCLSQGS